MHVLTASWSSRSAPQASQAVPAAAHSSELPLLSCQPATWESSWGGGDRKEAKPTHWTHFGCQRHQEHHGVCVCVCCMKRNERKWLVSATRSQARTAANAFLMRTARERLPFMWAVTLEILEDCFSPCSYVSGREDTQPSASPDIKVRKMVFTQTSSIGHEMLDKSPSLTYGAEFYAIR